jgi:hypothetical protein
MADANKTQLAYGVETVWGTYIGTLKKLRFTGESLAFNIQNITSNEIRSDRQVTDLIQTGADCSGGINFELSYAAFDDLIAGALCSTWVSGISNGGLGSDSIATSATRTLTLVGTTKALTATGFTLSLTKGQWINLVTADANNGPHLVTGFTGGVATLGNSTLVGAVYDDSPAATIGGSYIKNSDVEKSFCIERYINRAVGDDYYFMFTGMMVNTMQLTASASAIVTGSFEFIGKSAVIGTGSKDANGYTEADSNDIMNAVANVAKIMEGSSLSTDLGAAGIYFQELAFTVNNNLRGRQAIGTLGNISVGLGRCDVNGTVTAYFESKDLYDKYVGASESGLSFKVEKNGKGYVFTFPRVKFSSDAINAEGINTDIMERLGFQAIRHPTYDATIIISRFG